MDEQLKEAYRKITPSPELEHKILQMTPPAKSSRARVLVMRYAGAIAACMLLFFGGMTILRQNRMEISLTDGMTLSEQATPVEPQYLNAVMPRTASEPAIASYGLDDETLGEAAIPLTLDVRGEITVAVEVGRLMVAYNGDNCEDYHEAGQEASMSGTTSLYWLLPITGEDAVYDMTVNRKHTVRVTYDAAQNKYTVSHIRGNS